MVNIANLRVGDKVYYQPSHYAKDRWENGIVKEIPQNSLDSVRIVYNCGGDWINYKNYTSALTNVRDLIVGWRHDEKQF